MLTSILLAIVGLVGLVMAAQTGDTRWVVAGILLLGSAGAWWLRSRGRGMLVAGVILALLGIALMAVAFVRPLVTGA